MIGFYSFTKCFYCITFGNNLSGNKNKYHKRIITVFFYSLYLSMHVKCMFNIPFNFYSNGKSTTKIYIE